MTGIRKGMWVKYKGKLGIANSIDGDTAEVHLVDERGLTTLVIPAAAVASLTQAAFADIPKPRRPDAGLARKLGYEVI